MENSNDFPILNKRMTFRMTAKDYNDLLSFCKKKRICRSSLLRHLMYAELQIPLTFRELVEGGEAIKIRLRKRGSTVEKA
ncbi:MAG: hypothetical protein NTU44_07415 [Bacteroidetes bacterium]|nr:hypothetical protein [Bacteroidota bacterium]